jgi:hypothetical protein
VKWNFQKYLVDHQGKVLAMYGPREDPMGEKVVKDLTAALKKRGPFKPRVKKGKGGKKKDGKNKDKPGDAPAKKGGADAGE